MTKTIKPVMQGVWLGFAFNEGTSYSSLSGARDALEFFHPNSEYTLDNPSQAVIRSVEGFVVLYDYIYRNGLKGTEDAVRHLRERLNIPNEFPATMVDSDYDKVFNAFREMCPRHWIFKKVEIDMDFIDNYLKGDK